jgi:predicted RNase H-like nuclease (RuvC/YqgF family)
MDKSSTLAVQASPNLECFNISVADLRTEIKKINGNIEELNASVIELKSVAASSSLDINGEFILLCKRVDMFSQQLVKVKSSIDTLESNSKSVYPFIYYRMNWEALKTMSIF